ncbi:MAG: response regulator transcription factor [Magnetococcales bacterium]|nr:response regulator transcription factor [Magnetococcales bacterium]
MVKAPPTGLRKQARILIVEDHPGERELLHENLQEAESAFFSLSPLDASDLTGAVEILEKHVVDLVLLDLNLPDSTSLNTFLYLKERFPDLAVLVLTSLEDELLGIEAIRQGAQDYLIKGRLDGFILGRALRYALERQNLLNELERLRFRQRQHQEMSQLESYSKSTSPEGGRIFSLAPSYGALVRQYVFASRERQARPSASVQGLAQRLAAMGAGARDVVRLHVKVLKETGNWSTSAEERAFGVDARLALVELLGNLADLYRETALHKGVGS